MAVDRVAQMETFKVYESWLILISRHSSGVGAGRFRASILFGP